MSYSNFKPSLVLANLVVNFRKNLPGLAFCNTSITTGLKSKGTQLDINTLNDASANDVDEGTAMTYNELDTTNNSLTITLDKEVPVKIRDNDKVQIESSGQSLEAAIAGTMTYALADELDQLVFGKYTEITTDNFETGSTAWQWGATPTAAEISKFCASVNKDMDDNNCPQAGRFMALPNIAIQGIRIAHGTVETVGGDAARGASTTTIGNLHGFRRCSKRLTWLRPRRSLTVSLATFPMSEWVCRAESPAPFRSTLRSLNACVWKVFGPMVSACA